MIWQWCWLSPIVELKRAAGDREGWRHRERKSQTCCTAEDYWWWWCSNQKVTKFYYTAVNVLKFLPHDSVHNRGLCCHPVSVRPSVCLSRSCVVSRQQSNFFLDPVAHDSSFFWHRAPIPNSKGYPFSGVTKYMGGVEKFLRFSTEIAVLSRKRYEIGPLLLGNFNRKSQVADRLVSVPMTLLDLERWGSFFQAHLLNNDRIVWPRTTKFGRITCGWGAYFSKFSYAPVARWRGPSATQFLDFYVHISFVAELPNLTW